MWPILLRYYLLLGRVVSLQTPISSWAYQQLLSLGSWLLSNWNYNASFINTLTYIFTTIKIHYIDTHKFSTQDSTIQNTLTFTKNSRLQEHRTQRHLLERQFYTKRNKKSHYSQHDGTSTYSRNDVTLSGSSSSTIQVYLSWVNKNNFSFFLKHTVLLSKTKKYGNLFHAAIALWCNVFCFKFVLHNNSNENRHSDICLVKWLSGKKDKLLCSICGVFVITNFLMNHISEYCTLLSTLSHAKWWFIVLALVWYGHLRTKPATSFRATCSLVIFLSDEQ